MIIGRELRLRLLGRFRLTHRDGTNIELPSATQKLVAYVALTRSVHRATAADLLWPDRDERRSRGNLRSAVWRSTQTVPGLLSCDQEWLTIGPDVCIDHRVALAVAGRLRDDGSATDEVDRSAFEADLLNDWYDDWVAFERERFRQIRLHALELLAERFIGAGRHSEAIEAGLVAVAAEPLRETAHAVVIRAHLAEGNVGEARRHYRRLCEILATELGTLPTARTRAMLDVIGR